MAIPALPIISGLLTLGQTWLESRAKRKEAMTEAEAQVIKQASQSVADWEAYMAKASGDSYKDEWLTLLVSIPMILCFFPGAVDTVNAGFSALDQTPDWYRALIMIVFAASFGVRGIIKGVNGVSRS